MRIVKNSTSINFPQTFGYSLVATKSWTKKSEVYCQRLFLYLSLKQQSSFSSFFCPFFPLSFIPCFANANIKCICVTKKIPAELNSPTVWSGHQSDVQNYELESFENPVVLLACHILIKDSWKAQVI